MRITNEPAFVLHTRPWRESSLLVEALGANHGRLGLLARGVQGGGKRHAQRAALQPLQYVRLEAVQRGELAQLRSAEALDAAPKLAGEATMAAFYLNELVLRLAPRNDPQPDLFTAYARARARLGAEDHLGWTLRRFERDLLDALGFGFDLHMDGDGDAIDPAARYRLDPEYGPRRLLSDRGHDDRSTAATGSALLALADASEDRGNIDDDSSVPSVADLASLRRALRPVLAYHLGGRGLKSWELMGALGRMVPAPHR